ncbi:hypothetical protein L596_011586 [Steinernema carpocapsae]|uniref:Uncharacterized protein n=1 Tax=Steinernema carpocapsae TaxID=34508 RepID=A0A4U5NV54_STECR|nr:hypothetical protein L596_011586 [Steinernema carpocapsae]
MLQSPLHVPSGLVTQRQVVVDVNVLVRPQAVRLQEIFNRELIHRKGAREADVLDPGELGVLEMVETPEVEKLEIIGILVKRSVGEILELREFSLLRGSFQKTSFFARDQRTLLQRLEMGFVQFEGVAGRLCALVQNEFFLGFVLDLLVIEMAGFGMSAEQF